MRDITNVMMGHIHLGPAGANGDIILPLVLNTSPGSGPRSGVIGQGTATAAQLVGPLQGKILADLVAQMDTGNTYVNIHTGSGTSPATLQSGDIALGELRGQIRPATATRGATATAAPPTVLPATGGGYAMRAGVLPLAALAALLTLGLAAILRTRRRA